MLCQHHLAGCIPCQNGTAQRPQTHWRHKETGAPPLNRHRQQTPGLTPPLPGRPPAPTANASRAQQSELIDLPAGCTS